MEVPQTIRINPRKLGMLSLGAALVITGVVLKNGYAMQAGDTRAKVPGTIAFIGGWLLVATILGMGNTKNLRNGLRTRRGQWGFWSSIAILITVTIMINAFRDRGKKVPPILGIAFVLGWLSLGYAVGIGKTKLSKSLGLIAAVLVIISMTMVLPQERMKKITDGFGMPLFTAGWMSLALAYAYV